ncbi:MAG: hypothetical protein HY808_03550 [Nitrospirae bacterium]|nr:hypothetical protein [Nitrospirota bacterium]
MTKWIKINKSKIEEVFLNENIKEARSYNWEPSAKIPEGDHSHCIICMNSIPDKSDPLDTVFFKSSGGWLCRYCYDKFIQHQEM